MTVKEYLEQVYCINQRINSKLEQVASFHELAKKATMLLSGMPKGKNQGTSPMENIICKMIDLENEINDDIDNLVDLKREIIDCIKMVAKPEYKTILELRYLSFKGWAEIATIMGYETRYLLKLHRLALSKFEAVKTGYKIIK
jgi:DNA-directed RNA polymerase specialized sigma subunit